MFWVYGEPKIGKTTLASKFPGVWFLATERGQEFVECREPTMIGSWTEFLQICAWIETNKPKEFGDGEPIRTLVIDTVSLLFKMCQQHVCKGLGVEDPGELPHGKGWSRLSSEFERVMSKVRRWPYTLVCISHARQKEFKTRGRKVDRYEPDIGAAGYRFCQSAADLILYAHSTEHAEKNPDTGELTGNIFEKRMLLTQPQSWAVAGGRMTKDMPEHITLDYDELLSYFPETD
jgi:hypothetical protein